VSPLARLNLGRLASCGVAHSACASARVGLLISVDELWRPGPGPGPGQEIWESKGRPAGFPAGPAGEVVVAERRWWPMIRPVAAGAQRAGGSR